MNLKITNNKNILEPQNDGDAGYDLVADSSPRIVGEVWMANLYKSISYIEYDTKVEFDFDEKQGYTYYAKVYPRSSISKYNLLLCNSVGIIDSGYKNSIKLRFKYIYQPEDLHIIKNNDDISVGLNAVNKSKIYKHGDKIAQVIFCKHNKISIDGFKNTPKGLRGKGGFGSTGS